MLGCPILTREVTPPHPPPHPKSPSFFFFATKTLFYWGAAGCPEKFPGGVVDSY